MVLVRLALQQHSMEINRNIIIGVTGGIAAYKSPMLIRRLKEKGARVRAVMTPAASHFITALTLQAVSGQPVRDSLLDADAESGMDHIDLARWADAIIVAPASADFIARLAHGFANDLLSTLCLATNATIYVAPAMNQQMWKNPATQENICKIKQYGIHILGPDEGDQACGETGPGRMLDPTAIIESIFVQSSTPIESSTQTRAISNKDSAELPSQIPGTPATSPTASASNVSSSSTPIESSTQTRAISNNDSVKSPSQIPGTPATSPAASESNVSSSSTPIDSSTQNRARILITAGPTWEALDPVRGLTNHSSGKMGYSIARAFADAGHHTTLISGPTALPPPAGTDFIKVVSAQQMHDAVHNNIQDADIFISVAAIADYRPEAIQSSKIKKSRNTMEIRLIRNPDILKSVTAKPDHPFTVGFAAETDNVLEYAKSKLKDKKLDMIIANEVGDGKAFGQSTNQLTVISKKKQSSLGPDSKDELAQQLVRIINTEYENADSAKDTRSKA